MKCNLLLRVHLLCMLSACLTNCSTQRITGHTPNQIAHGQLVVPTSFSPNQDGVDDAWQIQHLKAGTYIYVYTFYGELVYHSEGEYTPWNGTYKGKEVPAGNYYYVINMGKGLGNPGGWVTLRR